MSQVEMDDPEDERIKKQVHSELEAAKQTAKSLNPDEFKSGEWFINLLKKVVSAYDRNGRATYFQKKYPGLPPDEIADKLMSVTVRYATVAGAIAGAAATASEVSALASAGATAALFVGTIGAEMLYLSRIQMRLVLDLSVVYDLQLDPEDPEDVLMIFGYALGVAPTELVGKGIQVAARAGAEGAVKKYISKGTLKAVQNFAQKLGIKVLQRTIIKYAVPIASAAVGSSYNYIATQSVGRIAKTHFKNRGKATDELRVLVSRQNTYDFAFPAAAMYMAQVDGHISDREKELYRGMLSRMSFDEHSQAEFHKLIASEETILEAITQIDDVEIRRSLVDVLALMAVYDGELAEKEREFLVKVSNRLGVPLNIDEVGQRTKDYQAIVQKNVLEKTASAAGGAAVKAIDVVGQALGNVKGAFGQIRKGKRGTDEISPAAESSTTACPKCGRQVPVEYQFCPGCGQSMASDKPCSSCGKLIPIDFAFCPHCGKPQN